MFGSWGKRTAEYGFGMPIGLRGLTLLLNMAVKNAYLAESMNHVAAYGRLVRLIG